MERTQESGQAAVTVSSYLLLHLVTPALADAHLSFSLKAFNCFTTRCMRVWVSL